MINSEMPVSNSYIADSKRASGSTFNFSRNLSMYFVLCCAEVFGNLFRKPDVTLKLIVSFSFVEFTFST